jgi:vanillate O-demethylase monooxygenase subunit
MTLAPNPSAALPKNCTFRESEWRVLSRFWHPIALSADVRDKPVSVQLLDEQLVVYRNTREVVVAKDLCLHRGARLSLGWIDGDDLVCGFHGFRYDASGACIEIPAHPSAPIPRKLCLTQYPAVERYGLIWTCLGGEPAAPLPEWPELEDAGLKKVSMPHVDWNASAGRHLENFNDIAHPSWVHAGTFGHRENPRVDRYQVEDCGGRLTMVIPFATIQDRFLGPDAPAPVREISYRYDCDLPFAGKILIHYRDGQRAYIFDAGSPVSARRTRIFQFYAHDFPGDWPHQTLIDYNLRILEEDRPFVESQCPEDLPIDLHAEIHIPADRLSVEYRRKLAELGLGPDFSA